MKKILSFGYLKRPQILVAGSQTINSFSLFVLYGLDYLWKNIKKCVKSSLSEPD